MAIAVGKQAPSFELESSAGGTVKLSDLAGKPAVLYFYPRDNTPGCTVEAQGFRDAVPALQELGAVVYGISKDSIASHCKFRDKYSLTFPLLTDPDGAMMKAYSAWGDKKLYGKTVTGIIRSTVLLDGAGKVVQHWPSVKVAGHVDIVVAAVRALVNGDAASAPIAKPVAKAKASSQTKSTPKQPAKAKAKAKESKPNIKAKPATPKSKRAK